MADQHDSTVIIRDLRVSPTAAMIALLKKKKPMADCRTLILPDLVEVCPLCKGWGRYSDHFIDGHATVWCRQCGGRQFTYKGTQAGVPHSVQAQIATLNGFRAEAVYALGSIQKVIGRENDPIFDMTHPQVHKPCWDISACPWSSEVDAANG